MQELFSIADEICLQVPDVDVLIDKLNVAGYLLKKGHRQYQVILGHLKWNAIREPNFVNN